MKKTRWLLMFSVLTAVLLLAGCGARGSETVTIELAENPTTGYTWSWSADNEGILAFTNDVYTQDKADEEVVGVGGVHTFTFETVQDGVVTLTFVNGQNWEGGASGEQYVATYTVENGLATLTAWETIPAPDIVA